jgi:hypothetical protein
VRRQSKKLPINQEVFEQAVLASVVRNNPMISDVLHSQLSSARVIDRWGSGAGFFVDFEISTCVAKLPDETAEPLNGYDILLKGEGLGDDFGPWKNVPFGFERAALGQSILFHKGGYVTMLECFTFGIAWPEDEYSFLLVSKDTDIRA